MAQIFISYSRDDRTFVDQLLPLIRKVYGPQSVWFDEDIHGGADWWEMILSEIDRSTLFIYLISNESLESAYCQAEMREALRLEKAILPILVLRLKPPYPGNIDPELGQILRDTQFIDLSAGFRNNPEKIAEMYAALRNLLGQEVRPIPQVITTAPTPKPMVAAPKPTKSKLPDVYVSGVFGVLIAIIAGVFGLWQVWFTQSNNVPTATPPTAIALAVTSSITSTLSGFEELQTVQAIQSAQVETQIALGLTQTEVRISEKNMTATAAVFASTETAARLTLAALLATPTFTLTPTQDPFRPITRNEDWTPVTAVFNGVTMVLVPAGEFEMGSTEDEIDMALVLCQFAVDDNAHCPIRISFEDEQMGGDNTQVFSQPFWIDQTEVARSQYSLCVADEVCTETPDSSYSTEPEQPINRVTWFQARAYCEWRGGRLPTEREWEYAARGPDRLTFPWGDQMEGRENHCDRNCGEASWASSYRQIHEENDDGHAVTAPVGSYPLGQSWVGALDLGGNVQEWISSLYRPYPYDPTDGREADLGDQTDVTYALRGGSFHVALYGLRGASRSRTNPSFESDVIGFRCARSYR